jgi:hypothetical protein
MELHGSMVTNLQAALSSAQRLRDRPVHRDTISFWRSLLALARETQGEQTEDSTAEIERLTKALEAELTARTSK